MSSRDVSRKTRKVSRKTKLEVSRKTKLEIPTSYRSWGTGSYFPLS